MSTVLQALPRLLAVAHVAVAAGGWSAPAQAQTSGNIGITVTVLSKSNCKFTTLPGNALPFGELNLASAVAATAQITAEFKCGGSASTAVYAVSASNGSYYSGGMRRMRHTNTTSFLPYSLSVSPSTGTVAKNAPVNITITGSIAAADFQDAVAGFYSDTVVISVQP